MKITDATKVMDLLDEYPDILDEVAGHSDEIKKLLDSPLAKALLKKANLSEICEHTGLDLDDVIEKVEKFIESKEK